MIFHIIYRAIPLSIFNLLRLCLFVACLSPGFVRLAWYYFVSSDRISVPYDNDSVRQRLDIYQSASSLYLYEDNEANNLVEEEVCRSKYNAAPAPVVFFATGGAWIIGYKMWGALLARALTASGIVVVIPDMRNYPLVTISYMVEDVDSAIEWTLKNVAEYGGDPTKIVVVGQSAGGHVAVMAIFNKIRKLMMVEQENSIPQMRVERIDELKTRMLPEESLTNESGWIPSDLKGLIAISSPLNLNLKEMMESFRRKGLDRNIIDRIFGFKMDEYDPYLALLEFQKSADKKHFFLNELPSVRLYHGTKDNAVPYDVSETFYKELLHASMTTTGSDEKGSVSFVSYSGWSHTDPILEGPMDGNHRLHIDLFNDVKNWTNSGHLHWPHDNPIVKGRLCPNFLVEVGRYLNPF